MVDVYRDKEIKINIAAGDYPHGAISHTDVTRELFIPANEGFVSSGTPIIRGQSGVVQGAPNLNEPYIYWTIKVPSDFVTFNSLRAVWESGVAVGNCYWALGANYYAEGEIHTTHQEAPVLGVTATGGVGIVNVQEPNSPLVLANLERGDYLGIHYRRAATDALDTLDQNMNLFGLLFTYVAEQ